MPRQLSGGQKQRIGVARAFAGNAKVVVADEPVSALDVSVQAAVTELLMDIQRKNKTTMLFISHDLSVVRYIADRVVVMYLGYIVEQGTTDQIFSPPYHPYTEALLSAIPIADTSVVKKHIVLEGDIPSAMNPPTGCPFQTRCGYKKLVPGQSVRDRGAAGASDLGGGHKSLCWLADDVLAKMEPVIRFDKDARGARGRAGRRAARRGSGHSSATPPKRPRGKTASAGGRRIRRGCGSGEAAAASLRQRSSAATMASEDRRCGRGTSGTSAVPRRIGRRPSGRRMPTRRRRSSRRQAEQEEARKKDWAAERSATAHASRRTLELVGESRAVCRSATCVRPAGRGFSFQSPQL